VTLHAFVHALSLVCLGAPAYRLNACVLAVGCVCSPMPQVALAIKVQPSGFRREVWVVCTEFGSDISGQEQLEEMQELVHFLRTTLRSPSGDEPRGAGGALLQVSTERSHAHYRSGAAVLWRCPCDSSLAHMSAARVRMSACSACPTTLSCAGTLSRTTLRPPWPSHAPAGSSTRRRSCFRRSWGHTALTRPAGGRGTRPTRFC
jgi:hypothetical protein